jgi:hypothetical protein
MALIHNTEYRTIRQGLPQRIKKERYSTILQGFIRRIKKKGAQYDLTMIPAAQKKEERYGMLVSSTVHIKKRGGSNFYKMLQEQDKCIN